MNLDSTGEHRWSYIREHYKQLIQEYGFSPSGVGWGPKDRQLLRIQSCLQPWNLTGATVIDIGCGYGAAVQPVLAAGARRYLGIDLVETSLNFLQRNWAGDSRISCFSGNFLDMQIDETVNIGIASGLLNTPVPNLDPLSFLERTLSWAYENLSHGLSFNLLRTPSSGVESELNTFSLTDVVPLLNQYTRRYQIDLTALPFEMTIHCLWESQVDYASSTFEETSSYFWRQSAD